MKNLVAIFFLWIILTASDAYSQTLNGYFTSRGLHSLLETAHPSNAYEDGAFKIQDNYINVAVKSWDDYGGKYVVTFVRISKGLGGLYFDDIKVVSDGDSFPAFAALKLKMVFLKELWKELDKESFTSMRQTFINNFGADIEYWSGKAWALLLLNLDYYAYLTQ